MKTKIFHDNKLIEKFVCDGKKVTAHPVKGFISFILKGSFVFMCIYTFGYVFTLLGATNMPRIVHAEKIVEVPVKEIPPVMKRIAKCESKGLHYWDGQVVVRANTNKTVDIGKYQINSIWNDTASKMGLDLTKEKDNEAFAMYLYETHGTEPWVYSKSCWK